MTGAPALYVKKVVVDYPGGIKRHVSSFAFRNGSGKVSTCISSNIHNHWWDGISLNQKETQKYDELKDSGNRSSWAEWISSGIKCIGDIFRLEHDDESDELIKVALMSIIVITKQQGTVLLIT